MRILFVTMVWPAKNSENMYSDLMSEFTERNHDVDVIALSETRNNIHTHLDKNSHLRVAYAKCGNIQKVNKYAKVLNSFGAGFKMLNVAKKFFSKEKYDAIIFALPPLTITPFIVLLKRKYRTKLYLLLKEFWPQDPVDLGALKEGGMVWKVFRIFEKMLYKNSDYIGTMSKAGIDYLVKNNSNLSANIEVCPNSQRINFLNFGRKEEIRKKYNLPINRVLFVFGGNFGVSQGIDEMLLSIKACDNIEGICFVLVGNGTEYERVRTELRDYDQDFIKMIPFVPRNEFDEILYSCDAGLIFLNPNYTVPNVPSRMISYLLAGLPIIAAVDHATDAGDIVENAHCGVKVYNGDVQEFKKAVLLLTDKKIRSEMAINSKKLMTAEYSTESAYKTIVNHWS